MHDMTKADKRYLEIKDSLQHLHGKVIAFETDSGDYFVGDTVLDAYDKASVKYPDDTFSFKRIGYKAVTHHGCTE